ncbi:Tfp pilus assembly protein FimT/FimU [Alicyclobacillus sp. SO9]|uniref:pilus assembly FimT family protein n=1 Tax=Alicyclobacillus sp. SO9 TaxID=2665646 RepID=UPI0018E83966|nr:hypothetical protein [Alicyclobacillus sp. SO9]QQE77550.1 hypothetical protein GI364_16605 [Alicyclobacillus sp. SO9]
MGNLVSRCKEKSSSHLHAVVQSIRRLATEDAGVTLLELIVAMVLSVSVLTTIGLVFSAETTSWNAAVSKEQLQSDIDTVNATLTIAFQNMNQAQVASDEKEVIGSGPDGTQWDIQVHGQDITVVQAPSTGAKKTKTFHFVNVSLSNSSFVPEGNTPAGGGQTGATTATNLVGVKLIATVTQAHEQHNSQELDVKYAVGSGF